MSLPPLKALPAFEAVARLSSFTKAAEELSVSQGAVSHRVRQLEEYLGEQLFARSGSRVLLTDQGKQFQEAVVPALLQIGRASERVKGRSDTRLRLAVQSSFGVRWLVPRLSDFQARHPEVDLILEMIDDPSALSERVADAFITLSSGQRGFSSTLLYAERLFPICSRQYWEWMCTDLKRHGLVGDEMPEQVDADWLTRYTLLSSSSITGDEGGDWRLWLGHAGNGLPESAMLQQFSHMLMAHTAMRYHQGIALTNHYMIDSDEDQDIVILPCVAVSTGDQFRFVYKTARRSEEGIRSLHKWIEKKSIESGLRYA
ncbi:LysR family transcriptional regulator [Ectothiorhodospiraceae bacterium WFHF3C12]|nr:LysR family transcriptional regulator [Ectothiorhodospiraceae bacterium WFHF3C12]